MQLFSLDGVRCVDLICVVYCAFQLSLADSRVGSGGLCLINPSQLYQFKAAYKLKDANACQGAGHVNRYTRLSLKFSAPV